MKTIYNKLVRDKIPEIIRESGRSPLFAQLNVDEYLVELNKKLSEEIDEYLADNEVEELTDIVEVVYAIIEAKGISKYEFERMRILKLDERGGFSKRLILKEVE